MPCEWLEYACHSTDYASSCLLMLVKIGQQRRDFILNEHSPSSKQAYSNRAGESVARDEEF